MVVSKNLVDNDAVGCDPAGNRKVRQALENPAWKPVINEGATANDEEKLIASNGPTVSLGWVRSGMIMQGIEKRAVDQVGGPNHGCRPDKEATGKSSHSIASAECCNAKEKLKPKTKFLLVEDFLRE
jgi:hypothetical protein